MSFAGPHFLWLLLLLPGLAALFFRNERARARRLSQIVAARLQSRLAGDASVPKRRVRFALRLLGAAGAVLALAQPRWGETLRERQEIGRDVLIAVDVSRSMLANDVSPSRLARTQLAVEDLIEQLRGDRIGLISFAGTAARETPLTTDQEIFVTELRALQPRSGSDEGGTNIAAAIRVAGTAFKKDRAEGQALVIFSDGEELGADGAAAAAELKGRVRIYTVGVGSESGTVVALPGVRGGTEFVRAPGGEIVRSRLDAARLHEIAEAADGFYVPLSDGPAAIRQLAQAGIHTMSEDQTGAPLAPQPTERYQWPLAVSVVLLAAAMTLGERRRVTVRAAVLAALFAAALAPDAGAKNGGVEAYERGDWQGALAQFERQLKRRPGSEALHLNRGAAAYQLGDWEAAAEAFSRALAADDPALRAKAEYNLANTLARRAAESAEEVARLRDWNDAIAHYDEALKLDPQNKSAQENRDWVRAEMVKRPPEPPPSGQGGGKGEKAAPKDSPEEKAGDQAAAASSKPVPEPGDSKEAQAGETKSAEIENNAGPSTSPGGESPESGEPKAEPPPGPGAESKKPGSELGGDLKEAKPSAESGSAESSAEQMDEASAAEEGRMTKSEARALLKSQENENVRVRLLDSRTGGEPRTGPLRDW